MKKSLFLLLCILIIISGTAIANENLDELESRVSRKGVNTFYSGEAVATYIWQPITMSYSDIVTGNEVWFLTNLNDAETIACHEYGDQPWSANGARFRMRLDVNTDAFIRTEGSGSQYYPYFVMRSDGTYLRPAHENAARQAVHAFYLPWNPATPDVFYAPGRNVGGTTGLDANAIYSQTVADTEITRSLFLDVIAANTSTEINFIKDSISGDGLFSLMTAYAEVEPNYIIDMATPELDLSYNMPDLDAYWGDTDGDFTTYHDEFLVGGGSYWTYFLASGTHTWWRMRPWGTDNGAPDHTIDNESPFLWWAGTDAQKEIQVVNASYTGNDPHSSPYFSHMVPDRWGRIVQFSDNTVGSGGPSTWDVGADAYVAQYGEFATQYHAWTGWTDIIGGSSSGTIWKATYNNANTETATATNHSSIVSQGPKPGQSPDGTKMSFHSDWLNKTAGKRNAFYVVQYYPYPPEIKSLAASSGTVTVTVEWDLNDSVRGYTTRGWPTEGVSNPPPPREVENFRLWVSTDKSTWTPVKTFAHTVWVAGAGQNTYNFSTGVWGGDTAEGEWATTTTQPAGHTRYYAVTSIEYSTLESRSLSDIWVVTTDGSGNGNGASNVNYPASPGADSNFYPSYNAANESLVRYYNVYAKDGSTPAISQTTRIASFPKGACSGGACSYVDWLGNSDDSTLYVVTAVDTQGNESSVLGISIATDTPSAGQYTVSWSEAGISCALTGTITAVTVESDIVTGGKTIILTLTNDTWVATVGADNAITTALIAGVDSHQSEAAGWDAVVKANMVFGDVTRDSDTQVTILLGAEATYDITASETITVTIPTTAVTSATTYACSPTATVAWEQGASEIATGSRGGGFSGGGAN